MADLPEQLLSPRGGSHGAGTHREETVTVDPPTGVLRRHTRSHGVIGPHGYGGPAIDGRVIGRDMNPAQVGKANTGQQYTGF
jgi:hypothetical protein